MLQKDYITELLDLGELIVTGCKKSESLIELDVELPRKVQKCPRCCALTDMVHDYRTQSVKDLPIHGNPLRLRYRKRRYVCAACSKRFYETFYLLPKWHRITNRTALYALDRMSEKRSRKDIAREMHVSESTMTRWMHLVNFGPPLKLPKVLSIDEFKGNTDKTKFHGILTDPVHRKVLDITPDIREAHLYDYLRKFPNRSEVSYFISDMRKEYVSMANSLFPNAKIVIDRFHVARYGCWAFENVRKRIQKRFSDSNRKYFKNSRLLLLKRKDQLSDTGKEKVALMLSLDKELAEAYLLKEAFFAFMDSSDSAEAHTRLKSFNMMVALSPLEEFRSCAGMLLNWEPYILNSFDCPYTNGYTEGCNNTIKVIKRTAYGYRNFSNFRTRILMVTNKH